MKTIARQAAGLCILCFTLALSVPAAQAQVGAYYHIVGNSANQTLLTTPNPLPPLIAVSLGGQLTLDMEDVNASEPGANLLYGAFQPFFGGAENVFVEEICRLPADPNCLGLQGHSLLTGQSVSFSSGGVAVLSFSNPGIYTFNAGFNNPILLFQVVVLPQGSGNMVYAGSWDPNILYPPNTIVSTGSTLLGLDFWLESNPAGSLSSPAIALYGDWHHISGPASATPGPAGPQGPQGSTGPQGPIGLTGPAGRGFVSGAIMTLPATQAPPSGATLLGSSTLNYTDPTSHKKTLAVNYYQLQ